ncbi:ABC transporter substrate-binding protein [Leucobacter sp. UCMA 4100]|uniref:ABC transporter substrate-binding protein n=1 Tax=Leucobacter sp. UCMA 4100 TaxID=2810534 RepID=UPI0022EA8998|nr:ABC transporter substrate-binding protein [Leucobacter sp. UCMA 4100]MDA3146692.1 ABC transporter substrate-binding protein [Leucobacter sp. UCMA 4100]
MKRQVLAGIALAAAGALALVGCSSAEKPANSGDDAKFTIGINQFVQHGALDAATAGFKKAFEDADIDVTFEEKNANGEQATAVTIAQGFASKKPDLVLAVATPSAQATAQALADVPVLFTAVTDAEEAKLVETNAKPGGNVTGTSDLAPIDKQLELIQQIVPDAKSVGIVYASGEVNSQVQVDAAIDAAKPLGIEIVSKTVTTPNDIQQATESLGDVDAIYVPTDNMVVAGIAALVQVAEAKQIPVIGAESGTVDGGAVATVGIDYFKLGYQTGEMAIRILKDGDDPADMSVEVAKEHAYVVNPGAAERMGVELPKSILDQADIVE